MLCLISTVSQRAKGDLVSRIEVKPVERDDVKPLIRMELPPEQDQFVSPNAVSLAQVHYEGGGYPFCIWKDGERVGLVQVIDMRECLFREKEDDPEAVYLWRLLIDPKHQKQGVGRAVVSWLDDWTRQRGVDVLYVTCVPENEAALKLYEGSGYVRTGRVIEGEVELKKLL